MTNSGQTDYQTIRLNNAAVHLVVAGCDASRAIAHLYEALSLISKCVRRDSAKPSDNDSTASTSSSCLIGSKRALPTCNGKGDFLFQNLITFSVPKSKNYENANDRRTLVAGILLNLAIIYHREAMTAECPQNDDILLSRAEEFYQKALQVVPTDNSDEPSTCACAAVTVKLAAVNNISQIRWERGDRPHDATKEALKLLFDQLVKKSVSGPSNNGCRLNVQELKGMLSNMNRR